MLGILVWEAWHCSRICLEESWCVVAPTAFPRFLMEMEVCRHPWHSSSLFLLPPLLSALHLLLLPSRFILIIPLQSSLFSSSPSLHDTVTTAPYYSLFKVCSGNQKHSLETVLRRADHGPSARRHPGTRESKGLSRLSPHKWPWGQRSCVAHTITLTLLPLQVPLFLPFMLCLAPLPD